MTLNTTGTKQGGNIKYLPYAFTEQGIAMLSAVLRSQIAIKVSIQIMNAFVEMRKFLNTNAGVFQRLEKLEHKQLINESNFEQVFHALENKKNNDYNQGVFFQGQIFDAHHFINELIQKSKKRIIVIDNYLDSSVINQLTQKNKSVKIYLLSQFFSPPLKLAIEKANKQYAIFTMQKYVQSHDRFLIIDDEVFHIGASLKDLGKKLFAFSKLEDSSTKLLDIIQKELPKQ